MLVADYRLIDPRRLPEIRHMLQPIAQVSFQDVLAAGLPVPATAAGGQFVDLLGAINLGLPGGSGAAASPLLAAATDAQDSTADLGTAQDPLAAIMAMLFGPDIMTGRGILPGTQNVSADTGALATGGMPLNPTAGQKKLPIQAADLAGRNVLSAASETDVASVPEGDSGAVLERALLSQAAAGINGQTGAGRVVEALRSGADAIEPTTGTLPTGAVPAHMAQTVETAQRENALAQTGVRPQAMIGAPLGSGAWTQELGDRLTWLVGRHAQSAEIVLNPPALGAIEVRLSLNLAGNEAGAQFYSANASVREALEAAFPRLREMMAGAGINLGDATVSRESFNGQAGQSDPGSDPQGTPTSGPGTIAESRAAITKVGSGLVDLYI